MNRMITKARSQTHSEWIDGLLYVAVTTLVFVFILTTGISATNPDAAPAPMSAHFAQIKTDIANRTAELRQSGFHV